MSERELTERDNAILLASAQVYAAVYAAAMQQGERNPRESATFATRDFRLEFAFPRSIGEKKEGTTR